MRRTVEQAEALAEKLRALPSIESKKRVITKQGEIKLLSSEIAALQMHGYTIQQIADILSGEGLEIGTATLKNYLQRSKTPGKRTAKKKPAAAQKEAPSTTPPTTAALPPAQSDHKTAQAAITRPDRATI